MGHEDRSRAEREQVRRALQRTSDARLARRLLGQYGHTTLVVSPDPYSFPKG